MNSEESVAQSGQKRRVPKLLRLIAKYPKATVANARVVILTPYADQQQFERSHMGSVLTWGLKRKGVDWVLQNPMAAIFSGRETETSICRLAVVCGRSTVAPAGGPMTIAWKAYK